MIVVKTLLQTSLQEAQSDNGKPKKVIDGTNNNEDICLTCKHTQKVQPDFEDAKVNLMQNKSTWVQSKLEILGTICIGIE